ncbi:39S ribosomal protein L41, mitochondrial-like [Stylophora pistillata]|uniref:39S ribosomal protein L41, mitochondrial-like n=1 Tax=Stylophora pistillata TaxID=50429 RepID=UPI000C040580|nr:39S ribosomal protein L41, mitochondrial-like [Stylophora pistillata]
MGLQRCNASCNDRKDGKQEFFTKVEVSEALDFTQEELVTSIAQRKVPQFVVPDLTGFELKPYVSMKAPKTSSPELTAEDLLKNIKENIHLIKYREIP